jgi:hypothetical protein
MEAAVAGAGKQRRNVRVLTDDENGANYFMMYLEWRFRSSI